MYTLIVSALLNFVYAREVCRLTLYNAWSLSVRSKVSVKSRANCPCNEMKL